MNGGGNRGGFTLIEVMVATIILSLGLAVLLTSFANCSMKSSYVSPTVLDIVKLYTGVGCFHPSHGSLSMASPLKRSRRPSNIAFNVESISDFPNRRGREMNNCWSASLQSS